MIIGDRVQSRIDCLGTVARLGGRNNMKTIFSTVGVRQQDRFDSWHAAARKYVVDHDARPDCRLTFEAKLCSAALDGLNLVSFESSSMTISHTSRHAAQRAGDELFVCRQLAGTLLLEQDYLEVTLGAGDMVLLDPRLPYSGRFSSGSSLLVVKVPRRRLEARIGPAGNSIARCIRPEHGENGLLSDFLALLPSHAERLDLTAAMVAEQALDLLAVALAKASGLPGPRLSSGRLMVLIRLRSAIEANLTNPALRRKCGAGQREHLCRSTHSDAPTGTMPPGARRFHPSAPVDQRHCVSLGIFGYDAFRQEIQSSLWAAPE